MPRTALIWAALALILAVPLIAAATSPLLAYRQPIYIAAGFAGVVALALLLLQPLAIGGDLPGLSPRRIRQVHRWLGIALVGAVVVHVAGLWITSPPDVIDALTFTSPTPFSAWGVVAMWAVFAAALVVALKCRLSLPRRVWRRTHGGLAVVIAAGTIVHAVLIDGTMEPISKALLCALVALATLRALIRLKVWA